MTMTLANSVTLFLLALSIYMNFRQQKKIRCLRFCLIKLSDRIMSKIDSSLDTDCLLLDFTDIKEEDKIFLTQTITDIKGSIQGAWENEIDSFHIYFEKSGLEWLNDRDYLFPMHIS